ncbi:hypothetical protein [Trinickia acidisoli]|uniref:hypothetical protein n=1 Tax=Trinickia acidisoli TaxID=2767482 RepID=UPI001F5D851F|nr:hypothetical protein [Trinickia acidisoli]
MNELSQRGTRPARCIRALGAAGFALALCACAHDGLDDVKPTATTAYRAPQPGAPQPSPATGPATAPTRE